MTETTQPEVATMGRVASNDQLGDDKWFDTEWVNSLTKEQAEHFLRRDIEKASHIFERLEAAGKIIGNGWHMSQELGNKAASMISEHWA